MADWNNDERMAALLAGERAPRNLAEDRFVPWYWENARFLQLFDRFTSDLILAGKTRYSAYSVAHRIRWEVDVATRSVGDDFEDQFKVSNSMLPYLARQWQERHPQYGNFFGLKKVGLAPRPRGFAHKYLEGKPASWGHSAVA